MPGSTSASTSALPTRRHGRRDSTVAEYVHDHYLLPTREIRFLDSPWAPASSRCRGLFRLPDNWRMKVRLLPSRPRIRRAPRRARALRGAARAPQSSAQLQGRVLRHLPRARHLAARVRLSARPAARHRRRGRGRGPRADLPGARARGSRHRDPRDPPRHRRRDPELPARVERMQQLAPDVMGLWLRLPAIETFTWQCGQYVDVMLPGDRRRSFSLANPPHDSALLELHVRRAPGGEFSEQVFGGTEDRVRCCASRARSASSSIGRTTRPLLADRRRHGLRAAQGDAARGAGDRVAPRRHAFLGRADGRRPVRGRVAARAGVAKHPHFQYTGGVDRTNPASCTRPCCARVAGLAGYDIYAAGPPAMIDAVRAALPRQGADPARIYFDSFD